MDKLSIKINIANRVYPMKIDREDEENVRKSVKKIESRLKFYEENYAINDKQDLLAMCLIEVSAKLESLTGDVVEKKEDVHKKLLEIESALSEIV